MTSFALAVIHDVLVTHGGTGEPLPGVELELRDPVWPGWLTARRGARFALAAYDRHAGDLPAATPVRVRVADPAQALRFDDAGSGPGVVDVDLTLPGTLTLDVIPAPVVLVIELIEADGDPVTGETVELRSLPPGTTVGTVEAPPGTYSTAPTIWGPTFFPAAVFVDGDELERRIVIDHSRAVNRVVVIEP